MGYPRAILLHRNCILVTFCVYLIYTALFQAALADFPLRILPRQSGEWGAWAARNLSHWRTSLFMRTEQFVVSRNNSEYPPRWDRYELFDPFISCPPGRPLRRVGQEDGGKWLCEPAALTPPCTILSLGSAMEFSFEAAALNETSCKVVTADCTSTAVTLGPAGRHSFLHLCFGSSAAAAKLPDKFATYPQLVAQLQLEAVPVLKIDIETAEYPFFAEWHEHTPALPEQIAVELHWGEGTAIVSGPEFQGMWGRGHFSVTDLALFFFHMANLGYGIVSREMNPQCDQCAEFTLIRVEAAPRRGPGLRARLTAP